MEQPVTYFVFPFILYTISKKLLQGKIQALFKQSIYQNKQTQQTFSKPLLSSQLNFYINAIAKINSTDLNFTTPTANIYVITWLFFKLFILTGIV